MIGISEYLRNKLSMQTLNSKLSQQGQLSCSLAFQMTRILILFKDNGDKDMADICPSDTLYHVPYDDWQLHSIKRQAVRT